MNAVALGSALGTLLILGAVLWFALSSVWNKFR